MIRRILLLVGSFLVLLLAYVVYRAISDVQIGATRARTAASSPVAKIAPTSQADADAGLWLDIESRDKDGRLTAIYRAASWRRHKDGSFTLDKPDITFYQTLGQQIHILADTGEIYGEAIGQGIGVEELKGRAGSMVQRGRLLGGDEGVRIDIMRDVDQPDQTIRVRTEDLDINNDLLQISTPNSVKVYSEQADIFGAGMTIRWNENPRELRELRLEHGQKMVIYSVPSEFETIGLPGDSAATSGAAVSPNVPMGDDGFLLALAEPGTNIAAAGAATMQSPPASAPAPRPARTRPAGAAPPQRSQNKFQADFTDPDGKITVVSGQRTITGAKQLSLIFSGNRPSANSQSDSLAVSGQPKSAATGMARPKPAPAGSAVSAGGPAAALSAIAPVTSPAKPPMTITWNGPLVVRAVGFADKNAQKDYLLTAGGDSLVLSDRDTKAACKKFTFESVGDPKTPRQTGQIEGGPGEPVSLEMAGRGTVKCPLIKFDRQSNQADLIGPGSMVMAGGDVGFSADVGGPRTPAASAASAPAPASTQTIKWADSVQVTFARHTLPSGQVHQYIQEATFKQDVHLREGLADGSGNYIDCDNLRVTIRPSTLAKDFRQLPAEAHAWGRVKARQEASEISCDDLVVKFDEELMPAGADGKSGVKARPVQLDATGSDAQPVEVVDSSDPERVVKACARTLTSKIDARKADLIGSAAKPARVEQGGNSIEGAVIHVDNGPMRAGPNSPRRETISIAGAGKSVFMTRQDFQGRPLAVEQAVEATWTQRMEYDGYAIEDRDNKDLLILVGDVSLKTDTDNMNCGSMQVLFEKPPLPDKVLPLDPLKPAAKPAKPRRTIAVDGLTRKAVERIIAKDGVEMVSEKHDDQGHLSQALKVTGKDLEYVAIRPSPKEEPDVTIEILGDGYMFNEDYRAPEADAGAAAESGSLMKLDRPSQTVFRWKDHMKWVQARPADQELAPAGVKLPRKSTVTLAGDVQMAHRSADKIVLKQKIDTPPWPKLSNGRDFKLDCQQMVANFGPPADKPARTTTRPAASQASQPEAGVLDAGVNLGELEQFVAIRDVVLNDGPMEIHAQQVHYVKARPPARPGQEVFDDLDIWGYLGAEKPAKASLHYEDPKGKESRHVEAPVIRCKMKERRIVEVKTEGASAVGTR